LTSLLFFYLYSLHHHLYLHSFPTRRSSDLKIPVPAPVVKPYLLAGGGVYNLKIKATSGSATIDTSETKFTWDFGGGATFGAGPASFFAEIRYVSIQESGGSTKFVPITVGVTFGGGKSSKK